MIERFITFLENLIEWSGRLVAWFTLLVVVIVFAVVILRYFFGLGWASLQELYVYLHSAAFMLGAAYTLKHDGHVRVDVLYGRYGPRYRRNVNIVGSLLLLAPVTLWLLYTSIPFAADSWSRFEGSHQSGGLPAVFLLKTVIPVTCVLLLIQGLCLVWRSINPIVEPNTAEKNDA